MDGDGSIPVVVALLERPTYVTVLLDCKLVPTTSSVLLEDYDSEWHIGSKMFYNDYDDDGRRLSLS